MAKIHWAAMFAAASTAALISVSIPAYAEGQEGATRQMNDESARQQRRADEWPSQPAGGTSGAAMESSVHGSWDGRTANTPSPYESTYLTPYELRTPGARGNIDD